MKCTAKAPSNIAFIKYWGKSDTDLRLPTNDSLSMNLSGMMTTTTVECSRSYTHDEIEIDGKSGADETGRIVSFLDTIRHLSGNTSYAKVVSNNSFPSGTGLSSSASGFAALALAGSRAYGLSLSEKELSILARKGSGSACRSIPSGFSLWHPGTDDDSSYATSCFPVEYWDIVDVIAVVSSQKKDVSTTQGQMRVNDNPFFPVRLDEVQKRLDLMVQAMKNKSFSAFGMLVEEEAFELHAMMMTSHPPLFYLFPESVRVIRAVRSWRSEGLPVYITLNTGQDVHCICLSQDSEEVKRRLLSVDGMKQVIVNEACDGARIVTNHLF